jgi:hypothetical protein
LHGVLGHRHIPGKWVIAGCCDRWVHACIFRQLAPVGPRRKPRKELFAKAQEQAVISSKGKPSSPPSRRIKGAVM